MKVPIKFRGRFWLKGLEPSDINTRLSDGDFVFGGYARMKFLFEDAEGDFIIKNDGAAFLVYPDSVAQLVCYDAEGNEVYEGDTIDAVAYDDPSFKYTFKAGLMHNISVPASLVYCVKLVKRGNKNE